MTNDYTKFTYKALLMARAQTTDPVVLAAIDAEIARRSGG